jgi:hypothetical protein
MRLGLIALLFLLASPTHAACVDEVGAARAKRYVSQCLKISPATHPPCNALNACEVIRSEIARGCALAAAAERSSVPAFCRPYLQTPPAR